jgi:hypothetical protein
MLYDLYEVFGNPGEEIWMLIPKHRETTFFLYEDGELTLSHSFATEAKLPSFPEVEMGDLW